MNLQDMSAKELQNHIKELHERVTDLQQQKQKIRKEIYTASKLLRQKGGPKVSKQRAVHLISQ
jgi:uncharacterized protein YukE